jgi:PilZ domain
MLDKNARDTALPAPAVTGIYMPATGVEDGSADRRARPRHRAVMRAARLLSCVRKVQGMAIIRNISEGGMLVQSHLRFEIGEHIVISLLDGDCIEGAVVWQDGTAFGIRFCNRISVDRVLAKSETDCRKLRPRPPRLTIDRQILLRSSSYLADARLCDISQRGAKIQFSKYLAKNSRVQISHDTLRPVGGGVKWQAGAYVGLEFHRTLSITELTSWSAAG